MDNSSRTGRVVPIKGIQAMCRFRGLVMQQGEVRAARGACRVYALRMCEA